MQEYQKDVVLKYRCSPGFKPREGIPKFGWTLNQECDGNAKLFLHNEQLIWEIKFSIHIAFTMGLLLLLIASY